MEAEFRHEVRSGRLLLGVFLKTASHQVVELAARAAQDFAVIDAEHAPFDPLTLDRMALAGRAAGLPLLVRPPGLDAAFVGHALDMGLAGVLAPHVDSVGRAEALLDAARFDRGRRGFSPSTRAGGYGAPDAAAYRRAADAGASVWCQIEDAAALDHLDAIAALEDVDCLFIGPADLALSMGVERRDDPRMIEAVRRIAEAGRRHGRTVGIYVGAVSEVADLKAIGVSVFVCGSDQSWMIAQGRRNRAALDDATET